MVYYIESKPQQTKSRCDTKVEQTATLNDLLRSYWSIYCRKSTMHGVRYLCDTSLHPVERLLWLLLVTTFSTCAWIAYINLMHRHSEHKLQTIVENPQLPVFEIPFPAVAVCTDNRINWQKFEKAKTQFLPKDAEQSTIDAFTTFAKRMEALGFGSFDNFNEMEDLNLSGLQSVNIPMLATFLSLKCEDVLFNGSCSWRGAKFECCDGFILEQTESGMCLVFNSMVSKDSRKLQLKSTSAFYPRHSAQSGRATGLNFRVQLGTAYQRSNSTTKDTVQIMIKRPERVNGISYTITPNTESYIVVRPEITDTDESTRNLSPVERNCRFADEHDVSEYPTSDAREFRRNNCLNACHEEYMIKYCNCTLPLFFPTYRLGANICGAADFKCLAKNNDIFAYDKRTGEDAFFNSAKPGMECDCLVGCRNTEYFTSLTTLPLWDDDLSNLTNTVTFRVDVHYQADVLVKYRTSLEFTTLDLIANFGGIFGLCLGASMVSAIELLYYLTFGLIFYLYDHNYHKTLHEQLSNRWNHLKAVSVARQNEGKLANNNYRKFRKDTREAWQ